MTIRTTLTSPALASFLTGSFSAEGLAAETVSGNANEKLVLRAMTELFVKRNTEALKMLWSDEYKQHNPTIADGKADLKDMIEALPAEFKYEPGFITSHGDIVMVRGRYSGLSPKPLIIVDIFRVRNGKLVEHWDVMQEEVPAEKSGCTMFE